MKLFNFDMTNNQIDRDEIVLNKDAIAAIAKENQVQQVSVAIVLDICNALVHRMNYALHYSDVQKINSKFFTNFRQVNDSDFLRQINALVRKKLNLSDVAPIMRITDKNHDDYVQPYTIDKVVNLLKCIGMNDRRNMNPYTKAILLNLLEHGELSNEEMKACVSRDANRALMRNQGKNAKQIRNLYDSSATGTAGTQCSSSKMSLRMLNICHVNKRSGKTITFNTDAQYTAAVLEILRMTDNSAAELDKAADSIAAEIAADSKKKEKAA